MYIITCTSLTLNLIIICLDAFLEIFLLSVGADEQISKSTVFVLFCNIATQDQIQTIDQKANQRKKHLVNAL